MNDQNKGCGCLSLIAGLLLAGGTSLGYLYLRGNLPWQEFTAYKATGVIPQETILIAHVSTEEKLWSQLDKMGSIEAQAVIKENLEKINQDWPVSKVLLREDLNAWIEGLTVAIVPLDNDNVDLLLVAGIKDKIKAWEYQQLLQKQSSQKVEESEYNKVKIYRLVLSENQPFYLASFNNYIVAARQIKLVEKAIDAYKKGSTFQDRKGLKTSLSELKLENTLAQIYIDDIMDFCTQTGGISPKNIIKFNGGIGLHDQGLYLQSLIKHEPDTITQLPSSVGTKILTSLPSDTWLLIHGHNLGYSWQTLVNQGQTLLEAQQVVDTIRSGFNQFSIDVDREVFAWMNQDYAIALTKTNQGFQHFGIGGIILIQTDDSQTADLSLDKFSQLVRNNGFISVQETEINHKKVTQWNSFNQPVLSHGWIEKNSLAMTVGMPFQVVTEVKPKNSLLQNETYKQRIATLPKLGSSSFYLDMKPFLELLNNYSGSVDPDTRAIISSIEGVVANSQVDKTTTRSDLMIFITNSN